MACNNGKSYQKSCARYYNNNAQTLAANGATTLTLAGAKAVLSGEAIQVQPQSFDTLKIGLYHLSADAVIAATAAGKVTLVWMMDGVALPCTAKTVTVAEGVNTEIHTETDLSLSACCCCVNHTFTLLAITDETAAGSVVQLCAGLLKLA